MNGKASSEGQKFFGDIVWIGLSQGLMSLTGLVILPAITKNYPSEYYGLWSQMLVTAGLLSIVLTLKFDSAAIRFLAAEDDREKRRRGFGTLLWPVIILLAVSLLVSRVFQRDVALLLFTDYGYESLVPMVFIWAALESLFLFFSSYYRARGKIKRLSVIRLASAVGRMAVVGALSLAGFGFSVLVWGVLGVLAVFVGWMFIGILRDTGLPGFRAGDLKTYVGYSVPLIPAGLIFWIVYASDRYMIAHFINISETGIYAASHAIANLVGLLDWPIGMVLFPLVSRLWEQQDMEKVKMYFHYSMKLFLVLAVPAAGGLFVLSRLLLTTLSTSEFAVSRVLVLLLAVGSMLAGLVLINEYPIFLGKRTRGLPLVALTGAVINVLVNLWLIPRVGIIGAAISTVAAYATLAIVMTVWGRKSVPYEMDIVFTIKVVAAAGAMVAGIWFIPIEGAPGIPALAAIGIVIYGLMLAALRTFSKEDISLIRRTISGLATRSVHGGMNVQTGLI